MAGLRSRSVHSHFPLGECPENLIVSYLYRGGGRSETVNFLCYIVITTGEGRGQKVLCYDNMFSARFLLKVVSDSPIRRLIFVTTGLTRFCPQVRKRRLPAKHRTG